MTAQAARFAPIGLDELNARAALLSRVDNKYIIDAPAVSALFERLEDDFLVLEIDGRRLFTYHTVYFDSEELDLYRSCHAYLQPSRGEGFGLQPLQALALGRPTILTNAHGHASFAHLGIPLDSTMQKAAYFTPVPGGVGLLTVAMLMKNTLLATKARRKELNT